MNRAIVSKDLLVLRRDRVLTGVFVLTLILVIASLLSGLQRERVYDKEKTAALATDKAVWMNQGQRNPHSAAHFSRYAFRPAAPLAMLEPGTSDFAGLAIWLEAHYQDPAVFRRAEDGGELSRYVQLTPAFLVLTIAPLIVFLMLFGCVAGEREDGTLRQLLATGVESKTFFGGKLGAGLRITIIAFTLVFAAVVAVAGLVSPADFAVDTMARLLLLYVLYALYLFVFVAIAIGVSALFRSRQSAFVALAGIWALMVVVLPQFAADVATNVYPQPDAREATAQLSAASSTYYADPELREQIEQEVLDRYGVATTDELPIDYGAYVLQVSEDLSEPEFDRFYADLDNRYDDQEAIIRRFGLLTPAVATSRLSRGVAGTDRLHQRDFAAASEAHRREMVELLNADFMLNGADVGYAYTAGAELWARFEDLDYQSPHIATVGGAYMLDVLLLIAWAALAAAFSYWSVRRAAIGEEVAE